MWLPRTGYQLGQATPDDAQALDWHDILRQYSALDLGGVIVTGIFAFLVTGFLGYPDQSGLARQLFRPAAALFLWLCGILLLILLRHPALRERALAPVSVLLLSILLVGLVYLDRSFAGGTHIQALIDWLGHLGLILNGGRLVSNLLNFGVLGGYVVGMLGRWARRYGPGGRMRAAQREESTYPSAGQIPWLDVRRAIQGELLSGDFVAGAALAGLLALFFASPLFIDLLKLLAPIVAANGSPGVTTQVSVPPCAVSLPFGDCPAQRGGRGAYTYLSDIDVKVAVSFAVLGGLVLASASAINAWRAVQDTPARLGFWPAAERLVFEFVRTLLSAIGRLLTLRFIVVLKDVLWPISMLVATIGAALAAQYIQYNLHALADPKRFCITYTPAGCRLEATNLNVLLALGALFLLGTAVIAVSIVPRTLRGTLPQALSGLTGLLLFALALIESVVFAQTTSLGITSDDRYVLLAVFWLLIAMLALILGIGLWLVRWDVIVQSLIFLALFSFIVLDVFWVFSLTFFGFNQYLAPGLKHPFQLNDATGFSLACFLLTALAVVVYRLWNRPRKRRWEPSAARPPVARPPEPVSPTGNLAPDA